MVVVKLRSKKRFLVMSVRSVSHCFVSKKQYVIGKTICFLSCLYWAVSSLRNFSCLQYYFFPWTKLLPSCHTFFGHLPISGISHASSIIFFKWTKSLIPEFHHLWSLVKFSFKQNICSLRLSNEAGIFCVLCFINSDPVCSTHFFFLYHWSSFFIQTFKIFCFFCK